MNFKDLMRYGYCEDNGTYTVVLSKEQLKMNNINLEETKEEIKNYFEADNIEVE